MQPVEASLPRALPVDDAQRALLHPIIAVLDETITTFGMSDIPYMVDQTNVTGDLVAPSGPAGDNVGAGGSNPP